MRHLVIGFGDVGRGLYEVLQSGGLDVVAIDIKHDLNGQFDVLHVCFPYSAKFIDFVMDYVARFNPSLVIVHSTVPPGTTESIKFVSTVHSPIRGRHPSMARDIKNYTKFVGGKDTKVAQEIFESCGLKVKTFSDAKTTELGKLLENIRWGLNLAFTQEQERMCKHYGVRFEDVVRDFEVDCNDGRKRIGRDKILMPVLYPGYIGGHCIMPNVNILTQEYPSQFLTIIQESNKKYEEGK